MPWKDANLSQKVKCVTAIFSFLCLLLSFATPVWNYSKQSWIVHEYSFRGLSVLNMHYLGIWQMCGDGGCREVPIDMLPAWYGATRVLITIAFIIGSIASLFVVLRTFVAAINKFSKAALFTSVITGITGGFIALSVIIWAASTKQGLHFSFALACIAGFTYLFISVLSIVETCR